MHLKLPTDAATFRLPVNTLIFRSEGLRVAIVKNGVVSLVPITLGRDFGSTVEVVSGLTGGEAVVVNPPDSLADGQAVTVVPAARPEEAAAVNRDWRLMIGDSRTADCRLRSADWRSGR